MTLDRTADLIYCQTCANSWRQDDDDGRFYFRGELNGSVQTGHAIGDYTSPAAIAAIDPAAVITFCPRCDTEQLEPTPIPGAPSGVKGRDPFYERDDKMIGSDPDSTGGNVPDADPGNADNAVTHRVD